MDHAVNKLSLSIILAAAMLVIAYVGYNEYARHRDMAALEAAARALLATNAATIAPATLEQRARQAAQDAQNAVPLALRALTSDQRCIGGSVVEVHGHSFTQLGTIQLPVHCSGRYADRAIR